MESYKSLLDEHEALQREREAAEAGAQAGEPADVVEDVPALDVAVVERFLQKVRQAGEREELATRRETLRHLALTWADFIQARTGQRPPTAIADFRPAPVDELESPPAYTVSPRATVARAGAAANTIPSLPPFWMYVGIGLLALILILLSILLTRDLFIPAAAEAADTPVATATAVVEVIPPSNTPSPTEVPILEITIVATNTPNAAGVRAYTVQPGDTLTSIASRFDVDVELLRMANSLNTDLLQLGQTLWIPNEGVVIAQTPVTSTPTPGPPGEATATLPAIPTVPDPAQYELVVRGTQGLGTATLRARPQVTGEPITAVLPGTIATAVGRLADNSWYLLELTGSRVRGWLPRQEIGLIYPATPDTVPVIELP